MAALALGAKFGGKKRVLKGTGAAEMSGMKSVEIKFIIRQARSMYRCI